MTEGATTWPAIWAQATLNFSRGWSWSGFERSVFFVNDGGARFSRDLGMVLGADQVSDGRGLAAGDIDADGDLDLVGTCSRTHPHVYVLRNDLPSERHFVLLDLEPRERRSAAGTKLLVTAGGRTQRRDVALGYGYLAQHALTQHVGLGDAGNVERIEITWPDGEQETRELGPADRRVRIRQGSVELETRPLARRNFNATRRLPEIEWDAQPGNVRLVDEARPSLADCAWEDLDGNALSLVAGPAGREPGGPALLVHVWATWCENCRREMPDLAAAHAARRGGLSVIGVSLDEEEAADLVRETAAAAGATFPLVHLTGAAREEFLARIDPMLARAGGLALPTSLLLAPDGSVVAFSRGALDVEAVVRLLEHHRGR